MIKRFVKFYRPHRALFALDLSIGSRAGALGLHRKACQYDLVLRNGEVVERGIHPELTALNGYYHTLYTKSLF